MKGVIFSDNNIKLSLMFGLVILLAIPVILGNLFSNGNTDSPTDPPEVYWGVDSASYTDEDQYQCVIDNFGKPKVWGRYLGDKEGVSAGIDSDEVKFLHDKDIQILVIYNHFTDAVGYDNGVDHANQAVDLAKEIDISKGVAIFGDIEPDYPVDEAFIQGWYDTLVDSDYVPAIYGVFNEESDLFKAYNTADQSVKEKTVLWSAYPQEKITTEEDAPSFHPQGPDESLLYGWQYGLDSEKCNIDTNLFSEKVLGYLW